MSIAYGGIIAFAFRGLNLLAAAGTIFLATHQLAEDDFGLFALGLIVVGIANAATGGLTAATAYQIANQRKPAGVAFLNGAAIGCGVGAGAIIAALVASVFGSGDLQLVALPVGLAATAVIINSATAGAFLGRESLVRYNVALVAPPLLALTAIAVTFVILGRRTPEDGLAAYAVGQWLALVLMWASGRAILFRDLRLERPVMGTILRFAVLAGLSSGVSFLNYRADSFVLKYFEGKTGVGVYVVAIYFAESVWQVSGSLALATYARMGSLARAEAVQLATRVMRHSLVLAALVCLGLFAIAGTLESVFFSKQEGMATALRLLLPGVLVYSLAQSYSGFYTYQRGLPWVAAVVAAVGLAVDMVLAVAFIPVMGVNGAALASSIAYTVAILGGLAVFFRKEHISPLEVFHFGRRDLDDYRSLALRLRSAVGRG
ncbi:MAG: polysaccharide biosynthesis C-terminal domain-containing protein [Dehalococcoidia bacterium]